MPRASHGQALCLHPKFLVMGILWADPGLQTSVLVGCGAAGLMLQLQGLEKVGSGVEKGFAVLLATGPQSITGPLCPASQRREGLM
jgi:hypothetical protein